MYGTLTFTSTFLLELLMDAQILLHYLYVPNMVGMLPLFANFCSSVGSTFCWDCLLILLWVAHTPYSRRYGKHYLYVLNIAGRLPLLYSKLFQVTTI